MEFKAHFTHLRDKYLSDTKTIAQFTNTSPSQGLSLQAKFVKPIQSFIWLENLPNSIFVHLPKGEVERYYEGNTFCIQIKFCIIDCISRNWCLFQYMIYISWPLEIFEPIDDQKRRLEFCFSIPQAVKLFHFPLFSILYQKFLSHIMISETFIY